MAKRMLQDVISSKKEPTRRAADIGFAGIKKQKQPPSADGYGRVRFAGLRQGGDSRIFIWGAAVLAVFLAFFFVLSFFEKATVTITPKRQSVSLNAPIVAHRGTAASAGGLAFEIMTLSGEEKKIFPATQVERIDTAASGKIIIYNNFDSKNQQLVARTRFETTEGLIYRVRNPVVVPGQKILNGTKIPGSVEVTVYADESGEKYNIGLTDFTIPGFKGTPRFDGFYARSVAPMTGGSSGIVKTVSKEQLAQAKIELGNLLQSRLLQKAYSQKPDDFILYNDAVFFAIDEGTPRAIQTNVDKDEVDVIVSGTVHGLIFNEKSLSQFFARTLVPDAAPESVIVKNLDSLTFKISNKELFSPTEDTALSFVVEGNPRFEWLFDIAQLKRDVAGKSKNEFNQILKKYPNIQKAELALRPFWKGSFPEKVERIEIKTAGE